MNYLIQDGKSNYLEGGLLMAVYVVRTHLGSADSDYFSRSMVLPHVVRVHHGACGEFV